MWEIFNKLWDSYALIKAIGFSTIVVLLIRHYAYLEQLKEKEKKLREETYVMNQSSNPPKKSSYPIPNCPLCKLPLFNESGIEFTCGSIVQLNCNHLFHRQCYFNSRELETETEIETKTKRNTLHPPPPTPCPTCFTSQSTVSNEPLHMWQTISFWIWHINEALNTFEQSKGQLTWANVRSKAKEIANLSINILKEGDIQSFGVDNCREEEDLIGPGAFPIREAMLDAGKVKYEWKGEVYHTRGLWITNKSSEGTEREIWKVSWGSPPWAVCFGCGENVPLRSHIHCDQCHQINSNKCCYWCSESCKINTRERHLQDCEVICEGWKSYQERVIT